MKETEYKFLVDRSTFYEIMGKVKEKYSNIHPVDKVQINYYYDSNDQYLFTNHTTLRVRQIETELTLEMKESIPSADEFNVSNETEWKIDAITPEITLNSGKHAWIPFQLQGNLVTRRVSIKPTESLSIDFDTSCYFGKCDYEIEMEFKDEAKKATTMLVNELGLLKYKNMEGGKARRFFRYKAEIFRKNINE